MHEPPRVLIVEDDAQIIQAIRVRLDSAGYEVMAAENAERGLDLAAHTHPDVIVMDIQLPKKDGLTAMQEIWSLPDIKDTPVVILSARANERRHALELGARYFLNKPFSSRNLLAAIQASLNQPVTSPALAPAGIRTAQRIALPAVSARRSNPRPS